MSQVQLSSNKRTLAPLYKYMFGTHLMLVSCSCLNCCCALTATPLRFHVTVQVGTSTTMLTVSPVPKYDPPSIVMYSFPL